MTKRQESRKRAYRYIIEQIKKVNWDPPINSDERVADVFDIPLGELESLKRGLSDPSPKLVAEFKKLLGPLVLEAEIDSYLLKPFLAKP